MTKQPENDPLETLFAQARGGGSDLSDDLFARIMSDANTVDRARHSTSPRLGLWAALGVALGGWPTFAGLATAAVAGVWIGVAQPDGLTALDVFATSETAYDLGDLMPGFDALGNEG